MFLFISVVYCSDPVQLHIDMIFLSSCGKGFCDVSMSDLFVPGFIRSQENFERFVGVFKRNKACFRKTFAKVVS